MRRYSWKRALGITKAKRRIARATGIPTTKAGRQRKIGKMVTGGCLLPIVACLAMIGTLVFLIF